MADNNVSINAQLGCGALILVALAAYFGAMVASNNGEAKTQASRPSIFAEGNVVRRMPVNQESIGFAFQVVAVDGSWVKLKFNSEETFKAILGSAGDAMAAEAEQAGIKPADNPVFAGLTRLYGGDWWLNTETTTDLWQVVPKHGASK